VSRLSDNIDEKFSSFRMKQIQRMYKPVISNLNIDVQELVS